MSPFALPIPSQPLARAAALGLLPLIERVTGLATLGAIYGAPRTEATGLDFFAHALRALNIRLDVHHAHPEGIPPSGPLIVVANHPSGVLDGLAVTTAVARVRQDVKVVGNRLLARIPEVGAACIPVDVYGGRAVVTRNAAALRRAVRWVRDGHALVVFPAGGVESRHAGEGVFVDGPWHADIARVVALTGARVVGAYVDARPSRWLVAAGRLHWALRTLSLPRELLRHRDRAVQVRVGGAIDAAALAARGPAVDRIAYLRARTHALAPTRRAASLLNAPAIAAPVDIDVLEAELGRLPAEARLFEHQDWLVAIGHATELPNVLTEVGRLRETAFRAEGEGSGQRLDLDAFDRDYLHLVAWHRGHRRIAGAYRVGATDGVGRGWRGPRLYTRSLFRYGRAALDRLGPALELGRAFVHPEHQRDYATLLTLWKGIGAYLARHPRYRRLFGPVSLSADLPLVVRQVIVESLRLGSSTAAREYEISARHRFANGDAEIARLVAPRGVALGHEEVDALVRDLDPAGRPLPVLLRHYLKLGGQVLAFSVDPAFSGVVDGFMVVDLAAVPAPVLARYMGRPRADAFLAHHQAGAHDQSRPGTPAGERAPATSPQPA